MPSTTRSDRARRRRRLLELLTDGLAATQEEMVERLRTDGFRATQATISRDLEDIGAVRRHEGSRIVYELPERNGPPVGFGRRVFVELVRTVVSSGNLVIVHTFPGMASTVAAVLDASEVDGLLGTIAGDDTVLAIADERSGGAALVREIEALGGSS